MVWMFYVLRRGGRMAAAARRRFLWFCVCVGARFRAHASLEHGAVLLRPEGAGFLSIMFLRAPGPSRTPIVAFESRLRRVRLVDLV